MFNDQSTSTTFGAMLLIINRVLIGSASLQASLSTSLFTCRNNDLPRLSCRRRTQQSKVLIPLHALKHSTDQCMHSLLGVSSQVLARLAYVRLVASGGIPNVGHLIELARPVFFTQRSLLHNNPVDSYGQYFWVLLVSCSLWDVFKHAQRLCEVVRA